MKRVGLFLLLLVINYAYANTTNHQTCSFASELAKNIITKRIKENRRHKIIFDVSNMIDEAYQKKISHNIKENNQIIKKFTKKSYDDCMKKMFAYDKKNKAEIKKLKNKVAFLKEKNREKSGKYEKIYTNGGIHNVLCQGGGIGAVIQSDIGEIYSYTTKNGITHRNHKYGMTLDEASRLACKLPLFFI